MPSLAELNKKSTLNIMGLMSGTSCDGLDIALINVTGCAAETTFQVNTCQSKPYNTSTKKYLLEFITRDRHTLQDISQFNFYLARLWAAQITDFMQENKISIADVDLIGSHGQTIWHQPQPHNFWDKPITSTLQLGDPSVLANLLNIPVIGDFRVSDMALNGQGAPLIPYFDWVFFSRFQKNILALNIGGISNITFVGSDGDFGKLPAFDCGPGNMLIDGAMQVLYNKPFDTDGNIAVKGQLSQDLLQFLKKQDHFTAMPPPKSTGRELYNDAFLHKILSFARERKIKSEDIVHTLSFYTAETIYQNYTAFLSGNALDEIAIGGGGSRNHFIMNTLTRLFKGVTVNPVSHYGLDEDFKEAIGFAILANETIRGNPSNVPTATGAKRPAVLGKICLV